MDPLKQIEKHRLQAWQKRVDEALERRKLRDDASTRSLHMWATARLHFYSGQAWLEDARSANALCAEQLFEHPTTVLVRVVGSEYCSAACRTLVEKTYRRGQNIDLPADDCPECGARLEAVFDFEL